MVADAVPFFEPEDGEEYSQAKDERLVERAFEKASVNINKCRPLVPVFVPMCCDFVHVGHVQILKTAAEIGEVVVLLMTDEAMRLYKRDPAMPYDQRKSILLAMKGVFSVIPCAGPHCYGSMVLEHRPAFFLHGDDWKTGPQQEARDDVLRACGMIGARVVEPKYTTGVSSTGHVNLFQLSITSAGKLGVLVRTALNDIKRQVISVARETGLSEKNINRLIDGKEYDEASIDATVRLLHKHYPVPKRHFMLDEDTSECGAWFMTREESEASARTMKRTNVRGEEYAYYNYMDTATSSISPFKPELIYQLVEVGDDDPMNPLVVMNKGHLLGQLTFFLGPVNFYYTVRGVRKCRAMNTGESCLITPFVPHSFTSRDLSAPVSAIVAVTFSGHVREALSQLVHLDMAKICDCAGDARDAVGVRQRLVERFLELRGVDKAGVIESLAARHVESATSEAMLCGEVVDAESTAELASVLDVHASDLEACFLPEDEEVVFSGLAYSLDLWKQRESGKQAFASAKHMSLCGGYDWVIEGKQCEAPSQFFIFMFNYGDVPVTIGWAGKDAGVEHTRVLMPFGSATFKPCMQLQFSVEANKKGFLAVFKVSGCVNVGVLQEISLFAQDGVRQMTSTKSPWF